MPTEIRRGRDIREVAEGACRSEWLGNGAAALGLSGPVDLKDAREVYSGTPADGLDDDEFDMDDPETLEVLADLRRDGLINY